MDPASGNGLLNHHALLFYMGGGALNNEDVNIFSFIVCNLCLFLFEETSDLYYGSPFLPEKVIS